ncbi:hypothetical protein, partial [Microbulbifer magnicolonia]|uniref:hypothetical protein n=1 Tax=Microbulbifer magnicolonia TaxID=3109744 RepID=UPI002B4075B6
NRGTRILHIHSAEASAFCRLFRGFRCDSKAFRTLRITASGDPRSGAHYSDRFDLGKLFFEELFAFKNTFKKAFLEAANPLPASLKVARIIASLFLPASTFSTIFESHLRGSLQSGLPGSATRNRSPRVKKNTLSREGVFRWR